MSTGVHAKSTASRKPEPQSELIVLCDENDIIRFVSQSFAKFFGAKSENWRGREFRPSEKSKAMLKGDSVRFRTSARNADGECVINWQLEILTTGERLYGGHVSTDRRQPKLSDLLDDPGKAAGPAADSSNDNNESGDEKLRYFSSMSHEMRTPLNGILGMTSLLLDSDLSLNQRAYVEAVRESGTALLALINDVLDYSKLYAGKLELDSEPFDPFALVQSVTELLAPRAEEKGIEIASFVTPETPRRVYGDEARVRQILINLAGNGVKFTETGGVVIETRCKPIGNGRHTVDFVVRDTGIGINPSAQATIFDEFEQADNSSARRAEGTGLGLAISKRLAHAMGGDISLESTPGKGSAFIFSVDIEEAAPAVEAPECATRVIVATESKILAYALRQQLAAVGIGDCYVATNAEEAFQLITEDPKAMLLVDYGLVREHEKLDVRAVDRSLILITPKDRNAIYAMRERGFDGYLVKPVRQHTLMREVGRGTRVNPAVAAASNERIATSPGRPLRILLAEDNQINAVLATALIKRAGHIVDVAINGERAVAAVIEGDFDLVFMDMHMPEMDGLEAAERIRRLDGDDANIPIVALTANATNSDRQKCMKVGMDDFLPKPFEPADLEGMLNKWGRGRKVLTAAS